MNFIPDPCKQAQESLSSPKRSSKSYRSLNFKSVQLQEHLGLFQIQNLVLMKILNAFEIATTNHTKGSLVNCLVKLLL